MSNFSATYGPFRAAGVTTVSSMDPGYTVTSAVKDSSKSDCVADIVCTQNLLISSTAAFVQEYQDLQDFYYTQLPLDDQAQWSMPNTPAAFLALAFGSMFGFSLGADLATIISYYVKSGSGQDSICRVLDGSTTDVIIGASYLSFWSTTYNVVNLSPTQTQFKAIPVGQLAIDPKCIPEPCRCKLGSVGLNDHFTVNLTGPLQEVKITSVTGIFYEIAEAILESTLVSVPGLGSSTGLMAGELAVLSATMDQLNVNPVCRDCCDKNCMLDFVLLSVGDNKNCCSSVCCPDSCTSAGVSISAVPVPVLALPPDCCPPCSGPTSGPCKAAWDKYVSNTDPVTGEPCSAHQDVGPGVHPAQETELGGAHHHDIPMYGNTGGAEIGVGSTGRHWIDATGPPGRPVLSQQKNDGAHIHHIKNADGDLHDRHVEGAEFLHEVLNSCLSKCCSFYFASPEGVYQQTGEVIWHQTADEGSLQYSTTYAAPRGGHDGSRGGPRLSGLLMDAWLLQVLRGAQVYPVKRGNPQSVAEDLQGMRQDENSPGILLPFHVTSSENGIYVNRRHPATQYWHSISHGKAYASDAVLSVYDFL